MKLKGKKIGVALTGSFCTYEKAFVQLRKLKKEGAEIVTIFSNASQTIDSRFGSPEDFYEESRRNYRVPPVAYDQPGRADRTKESFGSADYPSVYRQYCGKAG